MWIDVITITIWTKAELSGLDDYNWVILGGNSKLCRGNRRLWECECVWGESIVTKDIVLCGHKLQLINRSVELVPLTRKYVLMAANDAQNPLVWARRGQNPESPSPRVPGANKNTLSGRNWCNLNFHNLLKQWPGERMALWFPILFICPWTSPARDRDTDPIQFGIQQ